MGIYLNPGTIGFRKAVSSEIYVDKTPMIRYLNSVIMTKQEYVSVSRPRRFGKTMAADMLCAYYGHGEDTARSLFENLKLSKTEPVTLSTGEERLWDTFLGAFDVVRLTMTEFLEGSSRMEDVLAELEDEISYELMDAYPDIRYGRRTKLASIMSRIYAHTGRPFVVVIDEWDAPMRERTEDEDGQRIYLDFLRNWLKDKPWLALAYMTGILPIKKYGKHSALNMFDEYSMTSPLQLAEFTGFTEPEVRDLCERYAMRFEDIRDWYDGYIVQQPVPMEHRLQYQMGSWRDNVTHLYSPLSVIKAMRTGIIDNYWNHTETYKALEDYIRLDFDGLKRAITLMMDGGRIPVDLSSYQNDMANFSCRDDVLALLIHLGYLGWDPTSNEAFVPNREVMEVFRTSTKAVAWDAAFEEYEASKALLHATLALDEAAVADALETFHDRADNRTYNSEAALSFAVRLAYYAAMRSYTVIPELDTGKGYADVAYIPSPERPDLPALVVELKWNQDAKTALDQIRSRNYPDRLRHYTGNLLLVGISYDADARAGTPEFKRHTCKIERA